MRTQTIVGKPKSCLNRNCHHPFYKESHLGWLPKSEVEAYAIIRCPKCKDTFAVVQLMSMVYEYKNSLPKDPNNEFNPSSISSTEINNFRKKLDDSDALKKIFEGLYPGGSLFDPED
jgi:hypothetical protein